MADDLSIIIKSIINPEQSKKDIQKQLDGIKDLKINIGIDTNSINELNRQLQTVQSLLANSSLKGIKIIDPESLKQLKNDGKDIQVSFDAIKAKYSELGKVSFSENIDEATGKIKNYIVQLEKADGIKEKLTYTPLYISNGKEDGGFNTNFLLSSKSIVDQTQQINEQQLQQRTAVNQKLEAINEKEYQDYLKNEEKKTQKTELEAQKRTDAEQKYAQKYEEFWIKALDAQEQKESQLQAKIEAMQSKAQVNVTRSTTKFGEKVDTSWIDDYLKGVNALSTKTPNLDSEFQKLTNTFNGNLATLKNTSNEVYNLGSMLEIAAKKMVVWSATTTALYQTWHFFTDGIKYVEDLNNTLTQISTATNKSQADVQKLGETYQQLGQTLGATTKEVSAGALEFYRQGLNDSQVLDRLKTTTEYAKISGLDFKQSAELLTAATNSMGISINKAADTFTYLGDATATGADEIGIAFQKVGGSAGALNVNFDKVASWIAVISSKTRESASTIGDSIKSILARFQSLKEKGFDETDGTKVNQVAKSLATVGIQLMDAQGQFRNFGTIMDEIGAKWSSLDNRHKAYIATTLAGTYQQSRFMNLMEGYGQTLQLADNAMQNAGTTQKKYDLYLQGTQASLDRLKNSLEGIWQKSFDSQSIKAMTESLNSFVQVVGTIVDKVGLMPALIGTVSTAVLLFNKNLRESITTGTIFDGTLKGLTISLESVKVGLRGLASATIIGAVFTLISVGVEKLVSGFMDAKEKSEQLQKQNDDSVKSWSAHGNEIEKLAKQYEDLNGKKLDTDQQKEYVDVQNKLNQLMPVLTDHIDEQGNAHLRNVNSIKEEIDYVKQLKDNYDKMSLANFESKVSDVYDKLAEKRNRIGNLSTPTMQYVDISGDGNTKSQESEEERLTRERALIQSQRELGLVEKDATDAVKQKLQAYLDLNGSTEKLTEDDKKYLNNLVDTKKETFDNAKSADDFKNKVLGVSNEVATLGENIAKLRGLGDLTKSLSLKDIGSLSSDQVNAIISFSGHMSGNIETWGRYVSILKEAKVPHEIISALLDSIKNKFNGVSDSIENNITSWDTLSGKIESAQKDVDVLNSAQKELDDQGQLSTKTIIELSTKYSDFGTVLGKGKDAVLDFLKAKKEESVGFIDTEINKTQTLIKETQDRITAMKQEYDVMTKMDEERRKALEADVDAKVAAGKMTDMEAERILAGGNATSNLGGAIDDALNKLNEMQGRVNVLNASKNDLLSDPTDKASKASKTIADNSASDAKNAEEIAQKNYENALKYVEQTISLAQRLQSEQVKGSQAEQYYINQEIDARQKKIALLQQEQARQEALSKTSATSASDSAQSAITSTKKYTGKYANYINAAAQANGIDPNFIAAQIQQESGFNANARNGGLFQLSGSELSLLNGKSVKDPQANISAGAKLMAEYISKYKDPVLALAAYNMGPGIIDFFNKHGGYSVANMQAFSNMQKKQHGYNVYGDPNYVNHVMGYYNGDKNSVSFAKQSVDAEGKTIDLSAEIQQEMVAVEKLRIANLDSVFQGFANKAKVDDDAIELSKTRMQQYNQTSEEYRKELDLQGKSLADKQTQVHAEANEIRYNINLNQQRIDQLNKLYEKEKEGKTLTQGEQAQKSILENIVITDKNKIQQWQDQVDSLGKSWWEVDSAIIKTNSDIEDSKLAQFDESITKLNAQLSNSKDAMSMMVVGSTAYNTELGNQMSLEQQISAQLKQKEQDLRVFISTLHEGTTEYENYTKQLNDTISAENQSEKALYDLKASIASDIVSTMKSVYEQEKTVALNSIDARMKAEDNRHKQATDNLDKEMQQFQDAIDAQTKAIDNQSATDDYNQQLSTAQKSAQDIQNQINQLSLDNSTEATAKKADLSKQLASQQQSIAKLQADREKTLRQQNLQDQLNTYKKQIDAQKTAEDIMYNNTKNSLDAQKTATTTMYDNLINDERHWSQVTQDVMKGNLNGVQSQLSTFQTFLSSNMTAIGQSISQNLIDKISQANSALQKLNGTVSGTSTSSTGTATVGSLSTHNNNDSTWASGQWQDINGTGLAGTRDLASMLGYSGSQVTYDQAKNTVSFGGKTFDVKKMIGSSTLISINDFKSAFSGLNFTYDPNTMSFSFTKTSSTSSNSTSSSSNNSGSVSNNTIPTSYNSSVTSANPSMSTFNGGGDSEHYGEQRTYNVTTNPLNIGLNLLRTELQKRDAGRPYDSTTVSFYQSALQAYGYALPTLQQLQGFKTGGYTGDWAGDDGRLAILHKKELILNADQTKDILQAVKLNQDIRVPNISNILSSLNLKNLGQKIINMNPTIQVTVQGGNSANMGKDIANQAMSQLVKNMKALGGNI